jgi:signal transduction histidine kinase
MCDAASQVDLELERAKLDALKELAYGASHEINNPLANISARAQILLRDESDPERRRALEAIHQQAHRAHEMISDLMLFARPPRLERRPLPIEPLLQQIARELTEECRRRAVELTIHADPQLPAVWADEIQLGVTIKALCVNALEAIGRDGVIRVEAGISGDGSALVIAVCDTGPGIPPAIRPHIFDPFFSGREAGRGLGFGLSKSCRIVTEHGGQLTVDESAETGARFVIKLPVEHPGP